MVFCSLINSFIFNHLFILSLRAKPGGTQDLFPVLHSGITTESALGPYYMP